MPKEIERKFLVKEDLIYGVLKGLVGVPIRQGYLRSDSELTLRARIKGEKAFLTIKCGRTGISCDEYEYPIPLDDAEELITKHAAHHLRKTRYVVPFEGHHWEIDTFHDKLEGIVLAELELKEEAEPFTVPPWIGTEVSHLPQFSNASLAAHVWITTAPPTVKDLLAIACIPRAVSIEEAEKRDRQGAEAAKDMFLQWCKPKDG